MRNLEDKDVFLIKEGGSRARVLKHDKEAKWVYIDGMIGLPESEVATMEELIDSHNKWRQIQEMAHVFVLK